MGTTKKTKTKKALWKRILKWFSITLGSLILLLFIAIFFFTDDFIMSSLKSFVYIESKKVYSIDFEDIEFNVGSNTLSLINVKLTPDTNRYKQLQKRNQKKKTLYDLKIEEIVIDNLGFRSLYFDNHLDIKKILIKQPVFEQIGRDTSKKHKSHNRFITEIEKISKKFLNKVTINEIILEDGIFDFYKNLSDTLLSAGIQDVSIYLIDFEISDSITNQDERIIFSKDVEFNFSHITATVDMQHGLEIDSIEISSLKKLITLNGINIYAKNKNPKNKRLKINIPKVELLETDVFDLVFDDFLTGDSLVINHPLIEIHPGYSMKSEHAVNFNTIDKKRIYNLFRNVLKGINFKNLIIQSGNFKESLAGNDTVYKMIAGNYNLQLTGIRIDSNCLTKRQDIEFADKGNLDVENLYILSNDQSHSIRCKNISLSTEPSFIQINLVAVKPEYTCNQSLDGLFPEITITNLDFDKLLHEEVFLIDSLIIKRPAIILRTGNNNGTSKNSIHANLNFDLRVNSFLIEELDYAIQLFDSTSHKTSIYKGVNTHLTLADLHFNKTNHSKPLQLKSYEIRQDNLSAELYNSNRKISFDKLYISSQDSALQLSNASFVKLNQDSAHKNIPESIHFDALRLNQLHPFKFFYDKRFIAGKLSLVNPVIKMGSSAKYSSPKHSKADTASLLKELFFEHVSLENMEINVLYENKPGRLKDVDLDLYNFNFVAGRQNNKLLFSDDIELNIRDFDMDIPERNHQLIVKDISLSTKYKQINFTGLKIKPVNQDKNNASFYLDLPHLSLNGVDFASLHNNNTLNIDKIELLAPDLSFYQKETEPIKIHGSNKPVTITHPGLLENISINKINLSDGFARFLLHEDSTFFIETYLDFKLKNIFTDSTFTFQIFRDTLPTNEICFSLKNINGFDKKKDLQFKINDLSFNIDSSNAVLNGISIQPIKNEVRQSLQNKNINNTLSVNCPKVKFNTIDYRDLFTGKGLRIGEIIIEHSAYTLYDLKKPNKEEIPRTEISSIDLPDFLPVLNILNLNMQNINLDLVQFYPDTTKTYAIRSLSGNINNLLIDTSSVHLPDRILFSDNISLSTGEYKFYSRDSMYCIQAENINLSTADRHLYLTNFRLTPRYPKHEFGVKMGYQTDRMDIEIDSVALSGINFREMLTHGKFDARKLLLNDFIIDAYRDKSVAFPEWQKRKMPQEILKDIPVALKIDTINFMNGHITYGERLKKKYGDGEIYMSSFDGSIFYLNNDTILNPTIFARADFFLMGKGETHAELRMPLVSKHDTFAFNGYIRRMDLSNFNSMTINLFGVAIKKGKGEFEYAALNGNRDYVMGYIKFPFRKLKIQLINMKTGKRGGIGDGILTFLTNEIFLRSNNPRFLRKTRIGAVYAKRDPQKSIFNFVWKGLLSGMESTLGLNNKQQRQERRNLKKQQKSDK